MSFITEGLPYTDRVGHEIYTDFRGMMKLEGIFDNADMGRGEKWINALLLLYGVEWLEYIGETSVELLTNELLWFYCEGNPDEIQKQGKPGRNHNKIYDFDEDAPYIYAGFLHDYNVNLANEDLHLHWWEFMAMFKALSEGTQMSYRMSVRSATEEGLTSKQKRELHEKKKLVALKHGRRQALGADKKTLEQIEQDRKDKVAKRFEEARLHKERLQALQPKV